ncbi:hypothetical protein NDU88_004708 [Pleurodeles waltl]|uniref:Uncharacterized protein n=1 Tax=Pleurodeles waltl TaxID=8319 RepID=A0AAV7M8Z2_PLEWA|nr:hypothetical protein NDU88_004708 [Pleurodeles waltl]
MGKAGRGKVDEEEVLRRVREKQEAYDERNKKGWRRGKLEIGDWVRTRMWDKTKKGLSKWSTPKHVVKVNDYSLDLQDGRRWNASKITKCNEAELRKWCVMRNSGMCGEVNKEEGRKRRLVRRPVRLNDYVT